MITSTIENLITKNNRSSLEELCDSDGAIWIDWGESDDDICIYFAEAAGINDIKVDYEDSGLSIQMNGKWSFVSLNQEPEDRDLTIKGFAEIIRGTHKICFVSPSDGSDTLAFVVFTVEEWDLLQDKHGPKLMDAYIPVEEKESIFG